MNQKHSASADALNITFNTGSIARQANGAVTVTQGENTVFVAATCANELRSIDQDFFPLMVDYREKFHAAGRFPGGYFKREGRPSEKEILTSRLCDRPLRPLFPKGFLYEVQVIGFLLSTDKIRDPDILMVNGASAALCCSDIPWDGPIGAVRIGEINGELVANPTHEQMFESSLDLIYVGNATEMMMIEGSAEQVSEGRFIEALEYAQQSIQPLIEAQKELAQKVGKAKRDFNLITPDPKAAEHVGSNFAQAITEAIVIESKPGRQHALNAIKQKAVESLRATGLIDESLVGPQVNMVFEELQEKAYRDSILEQSRRSDGRDPQQLRDISCSVDVLPRVHGTAVFQRGETQALVSTTLGTSRDTQDMDAVAGGATSKSFILHYNFPPFSVGECGRYIGASRREIGHGNLAERSLLPVLPEEEDFPYTIRLVSDVMESNGSTSMASVCGGTLALMDAGVPIKRPVAGISCGLVTQSDGGGAITKHVVLTDIIGAEDHFGDMDFKICGTSKGITGFQLDLKIRGLPFEIAKEAIFQNQKAREDILAVMTQTISKPRTELKPQSPRIQQLQIEADKIGALIGPGGKNIKRITDITGAQIDINEDNSGRILVFAADANAMERAVQEIELVTGDIEAGKTYKGIVRGIKEFGAFVECLPGKEGLLHISEFADVRIESVEDVCKLGDEVLVKCIEVDDHGRARLSRRAALAEMQGIPYEPKPKSEFRSGGGRRGGDRNDRRERGGDRRGGGGHRGRSDNRRGDRGGPRR